MVWLAGAGLWGADPNWFEVRVVDEATGRGVPLVELETVDRMRWVTDSAGRVALNEPEWMGRTVFFHVRSHGYAHAKDGFGMAGRRVEVVPGGQMVIPVQRLNVAERLYRLTGQGIYRDSVRLGHSVPLRQPMLKAAVWRGRIHWFWGDTARLSYPLGNFRTTGATSELPGRGGLDAAVGVDLEYFKEPGGFVKPMCAFEPREGMIWIDGLCVVQEGGEDRLVARYARMKSLGEMLEHGLALFRADDPGFERCSVYPLPESWRCPRGQSLRAEVGGAEHVSFCTPFPFVRVVPELGALGDPPAFEAWTCLEEGSSTDPGSARVRREGGAAVWRWTRGAPPLSPRQEQALIKAGLLRESEVHGLPRDVESGAMVGLHGGSVRWNAWRKRWVMVAVQEGGTSFLGEVWYAESPRLTGPWRRARKVVTHDRYTFYNPVHHGFLDAGGGRWIHFEGTYSRDFSGNPEATPAYDYNQVMYRLDLDDARLAAVREE
jgi:hypothetical protein